LDFIEVDSVQKKISRETLIWQPMPSRSHLWNLSKANQRRQEVKRSSALAVEAIASVRATSAEMVVSAIRTNLVGVADHYHGATNRNFGTQDLAVRVSNPKQLHSAERPFVEDDRVGSAADIDVGDD
jgi:hypothetical protein